jgi:anhydro-N-acetylmuramic acid kinase
MQETLSIGLMSGTSVDGVDAAALLTDGQQKIEALGHVAIDYPKQFQQLLKLTNTAMRQASGDTTHADAHLATLCQQQQLPQCNIAKITRQSCEYHIQAVEALLQKLGMRVNEIDLIGYHGQTVYHHPQSKTSQQLADPAYMLQRLKTPICSYFRENDISHGGQGAPFAPIYHHALAMQAGYQQLGFINCGGISNLSLINGSALENTIAYDAGPGNTLLDRWVSQCTQQQHLMDAQGQYGQRGQIDNTVLAQLFANSCQQQGENYYLLPPPKSLDTSDINLVAEMQALNLEDGCATLAAFTAQCITQSLQLVPEDKLPQDWVLVGGGWYNPNITQALRQQMQRFGKINRFFTPEKFGWQNKAIEAEVFAYLAVRSWHNLPISYPNITGVHQPTTGGKIFQD